MAKSPLALLALSALFFSQISFAQEAGKLCAAGKMRSFSAQQKGTIASPLEEQYDVHYVKLEIGANNLNTSITGKATTKARVVASAMSAYVFELDPQMVISSATFNGISSTVSTSGDVRTITLPAPLPAGSDFEVTVNYAGSTTGEFSFFPKGLSNMSSPSWGNKVTFTLSEAYSAKEWWPCKQSLTDKIDSSDVWLTVDASLKAGSNGVLENIVTLPGGKKQYQWKSRIPIDYYLISFSVAAYVDYSFYQQLGDGDSMLVQNYVYNNPATLPYFKNEIDSVGLMLAYYSQLFGRYPFWKEKYGHCMAPLSGGMEHQTMTTLGNFSTGLSAHELVHQWFGDYVTCGSWADIWLNEGFAGYGEYLFLEHFHNAFAAANDMAERHNNIMEQAGGSVYVTDTLDEDILFDSRLTYNKGAAVAHMLRYLAQDDSLYFAGLRLYLDQHQNSTALTGDLKNSLSAAWGMNLDTFFQQWIYGEGFPTFSAEWNQADGMVTFALSQTTSVPESVPFFVTPVDIRLQSSTGDTLVRVQLNGSTGLYAFPWGKIMTGLSIDPKNWLLNGTGPIVKNAAVNVSSTAAQQLKIHPNPAQNAWQISEAPAAAWLRVWNMQGQMQVEGKADATGKAILPAAALPAGVYILEIKSGNSPAIYHRLLRQ